MDASLAVSGDQIFTAPTHRGDRITVLGAGSPRLLMFLPAAFTPVCSHELQDLAKLAVRAAQLGVQLCVVSCDAPATLAAWLKAEDASGALIGVSDHWPHGALSRAVDAFNCESGTSLRRSWAIRADGTRRLWGSAAPGESRPFHDHALALEWAAGNLPL